MNVLYLLSVWIHILAAATWVGGMLFLVLVVVPWLRKGDRAKAGAFLHETGVRFRNVGWTCFAIVLVTGTFNLWYRGVRFEDLVHWSFLTSPFGKPVALKLGVFVAVLILSAVHDFSIGPRATRALKDDPSGPAALRLRKAASWMGRINLLLALLLVAFAVTIVRGWPF